MLINKICPMCKKNAFLRINSDQEKEFENYACYGGLIQEKLKSFNDFEREFVKTGYCPECQENLFMKELLYGDEQHAILRLANFNYKNEKQHIAIFFSFDKTDFDGKMVEELALVMPINLSLTLFSVVYPDEDGVVVVLELSQKEPVKDIVNRFLSAVQHDMGDKLNGNTVSAGVSSIFYKPERMKECVDEAKKAMRLLRGYNICHSARYFEEIGIYRFFFELGNDVELEDFMMQRLGELISYDKENNSDYIDTLETYLDFGCA